MSDVLGSSLRGRKDIGETVEQCAPREAYEEGRANLSPNQEANITALVPPPTRASPQDRANRLSPRVRLCHCAEVWTAQFLFESEINLAQSSSHLCRILC